MVRAAATTVVQVQQDLRTLAPRRAKLGVAAHKVAARKTQSKIETLIIFQKFRSGWSSDEVFFQKKKKKQKFCLTVRDSGMDFVNENVAAPAKAFANDSYRLIQKCSKVSEKRFWFFFFPLFSFSSIAGGQGVQEDSVGHDQWVCNHGGYWVLG
jgi:hypothetical protein